METSRNKKNNLPRPIVLAPTVKASAQKRAPLDYKDPKALAGFLTEGGKILPRRSSSMSVQDQKEVKLAIKRSRILALLPFVRKQEGR